MWFVVAHLGQWGGRWVVLLVNCDRRPTGEGWRWRWGSCSFHNTVGDDLLDSIDCPWRVGFIKSIIKLRMYENMNTWITEEWWSTDCRQALSSVLAHADTRVDPWVERAERLPNYNIQQVLILMIRTWNEKLKMKSERSHPGSDLSFSSSAM